MSLSQTRSVQECPAYLVFEIFTHSRTSKLIIFLPSATLVVDNVTKKNTNEEQLTPYKGISTRNVAWCGRINRNCFSLKQEKSFYWKMKLDIFFDQLNFFHERNYFLNKTTKTFKWCWTRPTLRGNQSRPEQDKWTQLSVPHIPREN